MLGRWNIPGFAPFRQQNVALLHLREPKVEEKRVGNDSETTEDGHPRAFWSKNKTGSLASEFQFQRDCLQLHTSDPDVLGFIINQEVKTGQSGEVRR